MRILHTSDWHLGKILHERSLLDDQRHALDQLAQLLVDDPHDLLVVAGDIFDRGIPPESAVALLGDWLNRVRGVAPQLPIVLIAGNHDNGVRLAWSQGLLARSGVHIRGEADRVEHPVRITTAAGEKAEVWAIPFLWPGSMASADGGPTTQAAALEAAVGKIRARQSPGLTQVAVAHCFAQGGKVSDSERTLIGQATTVDGALFGGFDYVALGHLHRPQSVGTHARYSGSLLQYSFSESGDTKGVLSVDVRAGALPLATQKGITPLRPLRTLSGTLDTLLRGDAFEAWRDDYLSITLDEAVLAGQPMLRLRARYPNLLQLNNPVVDVSGLPTSAAERPRDRDDLGADFVDFQQHLRGGAAPPDVLAAFTTLRASLGGDAR